MAKKNIFDSITKPKKKAAPKKEAVEAKEEIKPVEVVQPKEVHMRETDGGDPQNFDTPKVSKLKITEARFIQPVSIDRQKRTTASADLKGGLKPVYCDMILEGDFLHIKSRKTNKVILVPIYNISELHPFTK